MQVFSASALALTLALIGGGVVYGPLSGAALAQTTVTTGLISKALKEAAQGGRAALNY